MNNHKKLILILIYIISISCSSSKLNFSNDKIIISSEGGDSFSFNSDNPNLICLAFLNKFEDSILVNVNNKRVLDFRRNDTLSYKQMNHEEIFKTFEIEDKNALNKIEIFLLTEKSKVSFNLEKDKSLYLISRYNKCWFVTIWDDTKDID